LPAIEAGCPDLSLLTPGEQDRVWELFRKVRNSLQGVEPGITPKELRELQKFAGPKIEVPSALERYWSWVQRPAGGGGYRFDNLGKVETLRFVVLCKFYSSDESLRGNAADRSHASARRMGTRRWSGNGGNARKGGETS
jgi:hypothetical protein